MPTEKLREDIAREIYESDPTSAGHVEPYLTQADAVLRKVAEHLKGTP